MVSRVIDQRTILIAAWALIGLQCIAAIWLFRPWAIGDSFHYLALAQSLAHGSYGSLTKAGFEADVLRPPGYPLILCFLLYVLHLPTVTVVALQLLAYCAALALVQRYLSARGVNPVPFAVIAAIYPFPLLYSAYLLTESWAILATTVAALFVLRGNRSGYILAGVFGGIAAMVRADLLLLPFAFLFVILLERFRSGWLNAIGDAVLPVVAAAVVVLPYAVWNDVRFGRLSPVPLAGAVGTSLYLSTWQRKFTDEDVAQLEKRRFTPHVQKLGLLDDVHRINRQIGAPEDIQTFDPYDYPTDRLRMAAARAYVPAALSRIRAEPGFYANHVFHNLWEVWVTKKYPPRIPRMGALALALSSWAVFVLGVLGMIAALVQPPRWAIPWSLVPITIYPAAIHIWLHTEARYTAATRPLLMMFAAGFVVWVWERWRSRQARRVSSASPARPAEAEI